MSEKKYFLDDGSVDYLALLELLQSGMGLQWTKHVNGGILCRADADLIFMGDLNFFIRRWILANRPDEFSGAMNADDYKLQELWRYIIVKEDK